MANLRIGISGLTHFHFFLIAGKSWAATQAELASGLSSECLSAAASMSLMVNNSPSSGSSADGPKMFPEECLVFCFLGAIFRFIVNFFVVGYLKY